jgi:hypothetical protein
VINDSFSILTFRPGLVGKPDLRRGLRQNFFIPVSSTSLEDMTKGLQINLLLKGTKVPRYLIRKLLFKGVSILEWYLIFEYLLLNKRAPMVFQLCLSGILRESSLTRKGKLSFSSLTRPIFGKLKGTPLLKEVFGSCNLLEYCINVLDVPKENFQGPLFTQREKTFWNPKPILPGFIGVGYKDKGTLSKNRPEGDLSQDTNLNIDFENVDLLSLWESIKIGLIPSLTRKEYDLN